MAIEMLGKKEDLREIDWVKEQTKSALSSLQKEVLYHQEGEEVKFDVDTSISYLQTLKDAKTWQEMTSKNSGATIMAIQILLKNKGYDVGIIDGILKARTNTTSQTMETIKKYQMEKGLTVNGIPGPETLRKLLEEYESGSDGTTENLEPEEQGTTGNPVEEDQNKEGSSEAGVKEPEEQGTTGNPVDDEEDQNKEGSPEAGVKKPEEQGTTGNPVDEEDKNEVEDTTDNQYEELRMKKSGAEEISLTVDEAKQIVKEKKDEATLSLGITSIDKEVAEVLSMFKGAIFLKDLRSIDKEAAEALSKHQDYIYFNRITSIDKEVAEALSKSQGGLILNRITSIDKETAEALSKHQKHQGYLNLDGLTSIDKEVAEALSKWRSISFDGITSIDKETAEALSKCDEVALGGLTSIDKEVAEALSKCRVLELYGLENINKEVAEALSKNRGKLYMYELENIDKETAEALSRHKGQLGLSLHCKRLDNGVAKALSKHNFLELYLDSLEYITDYEARKLAGVFRLTIDKNILTARQKRILKKHLS